MKTPHDWLEFRIIKAPANGKITLPSDIRKELGMKEGDKLLLIKKGKTIMLEKQENPIKKTKNELKALLLFSERSLKKLWLNKADEIWDQYLK